MAGNQQCVPFKIKEQYYYTVKNNNWSNNKVLFEYSDDCEKVVITNLETNKTIIEFYYQIRVGEGKAGREFFYYRASNNDCVIVHCIGRTREKNLDTYQNSLSDIVKQVKRWS